MLRWPKLKTVIRREYLSRVKTKAFWISTILVPLFMVAVTVLPGLLMSRTGGTYTVALVTANDKLAGEIEKVLAERAAKETGAGKLVVTLRRVRPAADPAVQRQELKREVVDKKFNAVIVLPETVLVEGKAEFLSTNVSAIRLMNRLESTIEAAVFHQRLTGAGVAQDKVEALTKKLDLNPVRIGENLTEGKEGAFEKSFFLSYTMSILLYMTMMFYGYYVMRGVLEEKSSRIVEVVVANLTPFELMLGKILGIGAVGLTQYAIWTIFAMNLAIPGLLGSGAVSSATLNPMLLVFFVVFFVLGYFQFSSFYAAVGAAFNTEEEAQQMQSAVSFLMVIPLVLMLPVMNNPDSTVSVVLSLVPFFAPVLFFMRMSIQFPPTWQIALCLLLLIANTLVIAKFAGAVYRVGILMYGKKPTLREVMRWVRA